MSLLRFKKKLNKHKRKTHESVPKQGLTLKSAAKFCVLYMHSLENDMVFKRRENSKTTNKFANDEKKSWTQLIIRSTFDT